MSDSLRPIAYKAPLFMEFFRQEYWSGLPFPSPGDLPNPGIKPGSPALQADSLPFELPGNLGGIVKYFSEAGMVDTTRNSYVCLCF